VSLAGFGSIAESCTARFSTWVIPDGTPITIRDALEPYGCGLLNEVRQHLFRDGEVRDDAILHRTDATILPGVRPSISFASLPTASGWLVSFIDRQRSRFVDDNPATLRVDQVVCRAQVDREIARKQTEEGTQRHVGFWAPYFYHLDGGCDRERPYHTRNPQSENVLNLCYDNPGSPQQLREFCGPGIIRGGSFMLDFMRRQHSNLNGFGW
jgi:hypothetical protein